MKDFDEPPVVSLGLLVIGVISIASVAWEWLGPASGWPGEAWLGHRQLVGAAMGLSLLLSVWLPRLRPGVVAGALLSAGADLLATAAIDAVPTVLLAVAFVQFVALAGMAALMLREARQQARWDGLLPLRPEG